MPGLGEGRVSQQAELPGGATVWFRARTGFNRMQFIDPLTEITKLVLKWFHQCLNLLFIALTELGSFIF